MSEGGEKTEMPTPKKLRDARNKGQVCQSKDITSTALLLVLLTLIAVMTPMLMKELRELFGQLADLMHAEDEMAINEGMKSTAIIMLKYSIIFCVGAAVTGVASQLAQVGFLFTFEPLKPDLNKLNPIQGAKKIFSMKNLFEFAKNTLKVTFLGFLIYKLVKESIPVLLTLCYGELEGGILPVLGELLKNLAIYTAFGYILIAAVDAFFQKKNFTKDMMMTKDEVKREYKEMEGSQEVKQAQRDFANEILNGPPPEQAVAKSTVVVTNPTHFAVGIRYVPGETPLPQVTCKGDGAIAQLIKRMAANLEIPMMENVPLARALFREVKVGDYVPQHLFEPLVEILKLIKQLDQDSKEDDELAGIKLSDDLDDELPDDLDDELPDDLDDELPDNLDDSLDDDFPGGLDDSLTGDLTQDKTTQGKTQSDQNGTDDDFPGGLDDSLTGDLTQDKTTQGKTQSDQNGTDDDFPGGLDDSLTGDLSPKETTHRSTP